MPEPRPHDADLAGRLAGGWTETEAAEVEAWHYRFAERTFDCRVESGEGERRVFTPGNSDPEWNHLSDLRWSEGEAEKRLQSAAEWFAVKERRRVIVVAPWSVPSGFERSLAAGGWRPVFRHQWSFFDLSRPFTVEPIDPYEYVEVQTPAEMEQWLEVFLAVYDEDGELEAGYAYALRRSLSQPGVHHHLIRQGGEPVAIGTVLIDGDRSQIFNMVVLAGHRRRGLAEWLLNARLAQARDAGAHRLTALSDNARMDRWLEQRGFVPGWFTAGYAAGDGGSAAGDARHGGHVPSRGRDG